MEKVYKILITPKANKDLEDIFDYTCENWSFQQAVKYSSLLYGSFEDIASAALMGREYPYAKKKYIYIKVGKHLIFYRFLNDECIIIRILHEKMEVDNHL